jgi:hypothetical protein
VTHVEVFLLIRRWLSQFLHRPEPVGEMDLALIREFRVIRAELAQVRDGVDRVDKKLAALLEENHGDNPH